MRQFRSFVATLLPLISGLPLLVDSALATESAASRELQCVVSAAGSPNVSEAIGIVFGPEVPRALVEKAVENWSRCRGYRTDFPAFLIGQAGTQTIEIELDRSPSPRRRHCGLFGGSKIVLYAFWTDEKGHLHRCGSRVDGLTHELGHMLGLRDAPHQRSCLDHAMSHIDSANRNRRQILLDECAAVGRRWLTTTELSATELALLAANALADGD